MADGQGFCGLMCLFSSAQLYYVRQLVATQYPPAIRQRETRLPTTRLNYGVQRSTEGIPVSFVTNDDW
jgi:hypothetical protein